MRKQTVAILMLLAVCFLFTDVRAQDFSIPTIQNNYKELVINRNRQDDFDKQIESILKYFSSIVGNGFVNTASLHQVLGFDVGLRGVITVVPDELKDIIPDKDLPNVTDPLTGASAVPIPFLHGSVGLPGNFEVMGKFFSVSVADKPDNNVTLIGGAVKYGVLRGNVALPAITLLGGYQALVVPKDYPFGNVSTFSLKGYISKGFVLVTVYGGGGIDRTSLTIDIPEFKFKKDYNVTYASGTIGATVTPFPFVKVNADYNFGELKNIAVGIGVSFR
jgi:hypothetical protein